MKRLAISLLFLGIVAAAHAQNDNLPVVNLQMTPEGNGITDISGTATNESGHDLTPWLSSTFMTKAERSWETRSPRQRISQLATVGTSRPKPRFRSHRQSSRR